MFTTVILWVIAIGWLVARGLWAQKPSGLHARWRSMWAWALAGGCAGALVASAMGGPPFVGAILAAVVAGLVGRRLRKEKGRSDAP